MVIVGIHGKARSGKTTAANYLVGCHGFMRLSFADALKEAANMIFGIPMSELYSNKKSAFTRDVLQKLGTDCCRALDPDVWVKAMERKLHDLNTYKPEAKIVIDDVRFANELNMLKEYWFKAVIVKLKRNIDEESTEEQKAHDSETALDFVPENAFDVVYENTGSMKELQDVMDAVVSLAKERQL